MAEKDVKDEGNNSQKQQHISILIERSEDLNSRNTQKHPIPNIKLSKEPHPHVPIHGRAFKPHHKLFKSDSEPKLLKSIPLTPVRLHGLREVHSVQHIQNRNDSPMKPFKSLIKNSIQTEVEEDKSRTSHPAARDDSDSFLDRDISIRDLGLAKDFLPLQPLHKFHNVPYINAKGKLNTLEVSGPKSHHKLNESESNEEFIKINDCIESLVIDGKTYNIVTKTDHKKYSSEEEEDSMLHQGLQREQGHLALDITKSSSNTKTKLTPLSPLNTSVSKEVYIHYEPMTPNPSDHSSYSSSDESDDEPKPESGDDSTEPDENDNSLTLQQQASSKPLQITGNILNSISSEEFKDVYNFNGKGIWNTYGIEMDKTLDHIKPRSIDKLLYTRQLDHLAPIENRVLIGGQIFKVVPNDKKTWSLYRAIAQAVTNSEKNHKQIREDILSEIIANWMLYSKEMSKECSFDILQITSLDNPFPLLSAYKAYYRTLTSSGETPMLHIRAAARKFEFNYVLIDFHNKNNNDVAQCTNSDDLKCPMLYSFMKTRHPAFGTWRYSYNLLIPIGSETRIPDGIYPISICDALLLDQKWVLGERFKITTETNTANPDSQGKNELSPFICFSLGNNMFAYRPTYTHDLWSILSELLCKSLKAAPIIYEAVLRVKLEDSKYYLISKLHKRNIKGKVGNTKLRNQYIKSLKVPPPEENRGNTEDLIQAASAFDFSCTLIGLDNNGNFFWKECISKPLSNSNGSKIALFVRLVGNKDTFWYALEFVDRINPVGLPSYSFTYLYEQVKPIESRSTQASHLARPSVTSLPTKKSTTVSILNEIFSRVYTGRKWLEERVVANPNLLPDPPVVNQSTVPLSFANRIVSWLRRLRNGRVAPELNWETNALENHYSSNV